MSPSQASLSSSLHRDTPSPSDLLQPLLDGRPTSLTTRSSPPITSLSAPPRNPVIPNSSSQNAGQEGGVCSSLSSDAPRRSVIPNSSPLRRAEEEGVIAQAESESSTPLDIYTTPSSSCHTSVLDMPGFDKFDVAISLKGGRPSFPLQHHPLKKPRWSTASHSHLAGRRSSREEGAKTVIA